MARVVFAKYRQILAFFIVFEWGRILESAMHKQEVKCNAKLRGNEFSLNVSVLAVVCISPTIFKKTDNFSQTCWFFENCRRNTTASTETVTEKQLGHNSALHITSYLSIALYKILPHSKTVKNAKKLSVFGENDSRHLSKCL